MKKKKKMRRRARKNSFLKKVFSRLVGEAIIGAVLMLLYMHRGLIAAAIKGEELPEAPEGCPAHKKG